MQVSDSLLDTDGFIAAGAANLLRRLAPGRTAARARAGDDADAVGAAENYDMAYNVHSRLPLVDFQRHSRLLTGMHPRHFPQGRGAQFDPYRKDNDFTDQLWKQHTYRDAANRARAQDSMLLDHQNISMKSDMALHANLIFTQNKKGGKRGGSTISHADLASDNLKKAMQLLASGISREELFRTHPGYAKYFAMVKAVGARVPGTAFARKKSRENVQGLAATHGVTNVWFTLNPDEAGDFRLAMHAGFSHSKLDKLYPGGVHVKRAFLNTVAARDPTALATWFDTICRAIIKNLYGYDVKTNNRRRGRAERRGLLGTTKAFFAPVECAQRGGLHAHWTIWIEELGVIRDIMADTSLAGLLSLTAYRYFDSIVSAQSRVCQISLDASKAGAVPTVNILHGADAAKMDDTSSSFQLNCLRGNPGSHDTYQACSPAVAPPVHVAAHNGPPLVYATPTTASADSSVGAASSLSDATPSSLWCESVHGPEAEQRGVAALNAEAAARYGIEAWLMVVGRRNTTARAGSGDHIASRPPIQYVLRGNKVVDAEEEEEAEEGVEEMEDMEEEAEEGVEEMEDIEEEEEGMEEMEDIEEEEEEEDMEDMEDEEEEEEDMEDMEEEAEEGMEEMEDIEEEEEEEDEMEDMEEEEEEEEDMEDMEEEEEEEEDMGGTKDMEVVENDVEEDADEEEEKTEEMEVVEEVERRRLRFEAFDAYAVHRKTCEQHLSDHILSYLADPQEMFDARYVAECGSLVLDQCLHGKREPNWTRKVAQGAQDDLPEFVRTCHIGCFKTKAAKKEVRCRFGYGSNGKLVGEVSRFSAAGALEYKRDFAHVVPHFKAGLLTLRINMCLELLFMGKDAAALFEVCFVAHECTCDDSPAHISGRYVCRNLALLCYVLPTSHLSDSSVFIPLFSGQYITSYQVKGELDTHNAMAILCRSNRAREEQAARRGIGCGVPAPVTDSTAVLRGALQLQGHIDMPASFAAAVATGQPLEYHTASPRRLNLKQLHKVCELGMIALSTADAAIIAASAQAKEKAQITLAFAEYGVTPPPDDWFALEWADRHQRILTLFDTERGGRFEDLLQGIYEELGCEHNQRNGAATPPVVVRPTLGNGDDDDDDCADSGDDEGALAVVVNGDGGLCRTSTVEDYVLRVVDAAKSRPGHHTGEMHLLDFTRLTTKKAIPANKCGAVAHAVLRAQYLEAFPPCEPRCSGGQCFRTGACKGVPKSSADILKKLGLSANELKRWKAQGGTELAHKLTGESFEYEIILEAMMISKSGLRSPHPQSESFVVTKHCLDVASDVAVTGFVPHRPRPEGMVSSDPWRRFCAKYAVQTQKKAAKDAGLLPSVSCGSTAVYAAERLAAFEAPGVADKMKTECTRDEGKRKREDEDAARFTLMTLKPFHVHKRTDDRSCPRLVVEDLLTMPVEGAVVVGDFVFRPLSAAPGGEVADEGAQGWCRIEEISADQLTYHVTIPEELGTATKSVASTAHRVGRRYATFHSALQAWTFVDRYSSDSRWYCVRGECRHPWLENLWCSQDGKDRATRLKEERRKHDAAQAAVELSKLSSEDRRLLYEHKRDERQRPLDPAALCHISYDGHLYQNVKENATGARMLVWRTMMGPSSPVAGTAPMMPTSAGPAGLVSAVYSGPLDDDLRALQGMARSPSVPGGSGSAHATGVTAGRASWEDDVKRYENIAKMLLLGNTGSGANPVQTTSSNRRPPPGPGSLFTAGNQFWDLPNPGEELPSADPAVLAVVAPQTQPQFKAVMLTGGFLPWARRVGPSPAEWCLSHSLDAEQSLLLFKRWSRFRFHRGDIPLWILQLPEDLQQRMKSGLKPALLIYGKPGAGKSHAHTVYTEFLERLGNASLHQSAAFCGAAASRIKGNTLSSIFSIGYKEGGSKTKKGKSAGKARSRGVVGGAAGGGGAKSKASVARGTPNAEKQSFFKELVELTMDEFWAVQLKLLQDCSSQAMHYRSTKAEFMGGLLVTAMGDPYQKQWPGTELYGDEISDSARIATATAGGGGGAEISGEVARAMVRNEFTNVHFLDGQHRSKDELQSHLNTRCRNGSQNVHLFKTVLHNNLLCRATAAEQERFRDSPVVATRHGLLENVSRTHPLNFCRRHNIRAVVWDQPDTIVKVSGEPVPPTEIYPWLRDLIFDHPGVLPQNDTGKIGAKFCYIPEHLVPEGVAPYQYSFTMTAGGMVGSLGATGAVTHAVVTLAGIEVDDLDFFDSAKTIDEDGCWHLKHVPQCLYARLLHSQMGSFTIRDDLPSGVVPIRPQTKAWTLDLDEVSPKFWDTYGRVGPDMHQTYGMQKFGFLLRPGGVAFSPRRRVAMIVCRRTLSPTPLFVLCLCLSCGL
tara:strand:+ start:206 stop:7237 length:7032 start_codon:yes stop_codon:yes gene_type:complete